MDWGTGALAFLRTDVPLPGAAGYPYDGFIGFDISSENRFFPRFVLADTLPAGSTMTAKLEFRFGDGTATAPAVSESRPPLTTNYARLAALVYPWAS